MQRIAFTMQVKEGCQAEYVRRHESVWPEVLHDMERAGMAKMSIFMKGRELFVYMEVADYAEAIRILARCPKSVRWEQQMASMLESDTGQPYDSAHPYPQGLPEVFSWEADGA